MSGTSSEAQTKTRGKNRVRAQYAFNDHDGVSLLAAMMIGHALEGGATRIGLTRDGGALAVGLYQGSNYGTEYVRPDEDLQKAVREIAQDWGIAIAAFDNENDIWKLP